MAPPSIFILISAFFLSALHPSHTEPLSHIGDIVEQFQMELPEDSETTELLLQSQQLRDFANELAFDYMSKGDEDADNIFSNIAKREYGTGDTSNKKREYEVFVRRGVPPSVVKLTYGKRSDDKRFKNPFFFGKREDINDLEKRRYSPFMFGKREIESPHISEKRSGYSPFMFGKRAASEDEEDLEQVKRGGYSALYFGKRVPEIAKRYGVSKLYFGKRGHRGGYSKFMFGKREDGLSGMAVDEDEMEENFEKKDALTENKRFKSSFYLGKRNYVAENLDNMEDLKDV